MAPGHLAVPNAEYLLSLSLISVPGRGHRSSDSVIHGTRARTRATRRARRPSWH